jgi:predicted ATPase
MLTRLKVSGFKNLLEVDVYFGPFTCIAGANGVGKSNLFDAITFLRLLAREPLLEAALSIRDEEEKSGDIRSLFFHHRGEHAESMRFEAWMITPRDGVDELHQPAHATNTFLHYVLELRYREDDADVGPLEIIEETLDSVTKGKAHQHILFEHSARDWREPIIDSNRRAKTPFVSTTSEGEERRIQIHQDGSQGRPQPLLARRLPRTVLSSVNASENPTAVVARNEMRAWKLLQLEPSALRQSDPMRHAPRTLAANGAHMAASLHHLIKRGPEVPSVRQTVANRVAELVEDIADVWVDEDEKRELLTLHARMRDGTDHPARSLSDGTLRFLALAIIEQSNEPGGLYCLEEPENGIHPERVPAMLKLLRDIATDPQEPVDDLNPLRQVIINTHSPVVVSQVLEESLVIAEPWRRQWRSHDVQSVRFSALPGVWRTKNAGAPECPKGKLLGYLSPIPSEVETTSASGQQQRRVIDREDVQPLLPGVAR